MKFAGGEPYVQFWELDLEPLYSDVPRLICLWRYICYDMGNELVGTGGRRRVAILVSRHSAGL